MMKGLLAGNLLSGSSMKHILHEKGTASDSDPTARLE